MSNVLKLNEDLLFPRSLPAAESLSHDQPANEPSLLLCTPTRINRAQQSRDEEQNLLRQFSVSVSLACRDTTLFHRTIICLLEFDTKLHGTTSCICRKGKNIDTMKWRIEKWMPTHSLEGQCQSRETGTHVNNESNVEFDVEWASTGWVGLLRAYQISKYWSQQI